MRDPFSFLPRRCAKTCERLCSGRVTVSVDHPCRLIDLYLLTVENTAISLIDDRDKVS